MSSAPISAPGASVSLYDDRPFFEKALVFGVQNGILDQRKLDEICVDAPKGIVQIARYFGSEHLRPELDRAKDRLINLVSIYLESSSHGNLHKAAESLRDHSFLSRSKGGSDMIKALIAMPQSSHFGMIESSSFTADHIPRAAEWSIKNYSEYQKKLKPRLKSAQRLEAAIWLADRLGMDVSELEFAGKDADAVIRTALLVLATKGCEMPDWVGFKKIITWLRKKHEAQKSPDAPGSEDAAKPKPPFLAITLPRELPAEFKKTVEQIRTSLVSDLDLIVNSKASVRDLFAPPHRLWSHYFWVEDGMSEVDNHDRQISKTWSKTTGGHSDDSSLLTLLLCVATESAPKTLLTEKAALTLIRKIRKSGIHAALASQFLLDYAPAEHQENYADLWSAFMEEARSTLQSDSDYALKDALALLRQECNVK